MSFFNSRLNAVLFLMLAMSTQAAAMTVYDIIQLSNKNYSDQDIIALIETTGSAFELKADDIPRLVELGVSEPVIQVMLSAVPTEPPVEPNPAVTSGQLGIKSDNLFPRAIIDSQPLTEPGSGRHHHQVINFSGIRLFVLRDEGDYPSLAARARTVTDRLRAASALDGQFRPAHVAGSHTVVFTATEASQPITVISISAHDASAYQRRSGRQVTPDLLAAYWSDLLNDYWSIALSGQPPDRLSALHEGEALQALYKSLDTSIDNDADRLASAFQLLPKREQDHLLQLAVSVPRDFDNIDKHTDEAP